MEAWAHTRLTREVRLHVQLRRAPRKQKSWMEDIMGEGALTRQSRSTRPNARLAVLDHAVPNTRESLG